ncbi:MAG: TonB-dependent receptor, partial [Phycisphaerae bacterium]|nr:TonB-dependent receptor [Phycisphaerae bacterium]
SGSLWLKHTCQNGPLKDFGVGAGVFASSARAGDNNNTFDLPAYARLDVGAWYTRTLHSGQKVKLEVNVLNLLDKTYYESSSSAGSVQPGAPLTLMVTLTLTF